MTDIVEDLAKFNGKWPYEQARLEIVSLRQQLKVQQDAANHWFTEANNDHNRCVKLEQQLAECQADNKRLRDALKQFAEVRLSEDNCASFEVANKRIKNIAVKALALPSDSTAPDALKKQWQREALIEMMVVYNQMAISGVAYSFYDKLASKAKELE
jgi:hypothetical protein